MYKTFSNKNLLAFGEGMVLMSVTLRSEKNQGPRMSIAHIM